MWIPYDIRSSLKAESAADVCAQSRADLSERDFVVGFYLRNPVTQVWEADLVASEAGQQITVSSDMHISLYGNDAGKLTEVIYQLRAVSVEGALHAAHADFQPRLLRWIAQIGRGMAIGGWRIADLAHGARWRCTPFRPSAMQVDFQALPLVEADLAPWIELFQRSRNAGDAASRLMAAFAVLNAADRGDAALGRSGAAGFNVTQEMLIHSGALAHPTVLKGLDLAGLIAVLRPEHARLIGPDGMLTPIRDDLAAQQQMAMLANLADLATHHLIMAELRAREGQAQPVAPIPAADARGFHDAALGV
ncbi:MAG: methylamine utilization protein MauJ [Paracoccus sp. (in: a-proteobacteria)]|nr:methylamine utilization protein MauJ [Paracoccus sp. (in: a-proteobacteria)]